MAVQIPGIWAELTPDNLAKLQKKYESPEMASASPQPVAASAPMLDDRQKEAAREMFMNPELRDTVQQGRKAIKRSKSALE